MKLTAQCVGFEAHTVITWFTKSFCDGSGLSVEIYFPYIIYNKDIIILNVYLILVILIYTKERERERLT
jgi:hypothetical protein